MKGNIEIIQALSRAEFDMLGVFLDSPIYNTSQRLRDYYAFIHKNYDKCVERCLSKDDIKKGFFKARTLADEKKAETNYRKLVSDFNKKLEEYLVFIERQNEKPDGKVLLLRSLRLRCLNNRFELLGKELGKIFERHIPMEPEDYRLKRKFLEELRLYGFSSDYHSTSPLIQEESDSIDDLFISDKMGAFQNMFSLEYVNKKNKHNWSFYDSISKYIEMDLKEIKKHHPSIYFNYAILKLARDPSDQKMYTDVKLFLDHNLNHLPPERLKRFTFDLINFCYLKVNEGQSEFRKEIHSLIKLLDENNLLLADGDINHSYFKTAVDNSASIRELDWLEYFINKYSNRIEANYRENLTNLAFTKLYLYKGDPDRAREFESKINYKDYIHYLDAKLTLARIEYEASNTTQVISIIDSVRKYLSKNPDISEVYNTFYKKFIISLTNLIRIHERAIKGDSMGYERDKLKKEIEAEKRPFYGKLWLLSKLDKNKNGA